MQDGKNTARHTSVSKVSTRRQSHVGIDEQATDLHVGRRPRKGLHIDTPLLRVQPESLECPFLQHEWTAWMVHQASGATRRDACQMKGHKT